MTSADTSGAGSLAGKVSADWTLAAAKPADNEESDVDEEDDEEDFQFQSGAFHHEDAASGGEEVGTTCKDAEQSFSRWMRGMYGGTGVQLCFSATGRSLRWYGPLNGLMPSGPAVSRANLSSEMTNCTRGENKVSRKS